MGKLIAPLGIVLGAAVWFLLFVILGVALGTSFIAGGCVVGAAVVAAAMIGLGPVVDAPLTASGLLCGIAAFVILAVVLSVPLWVSIVAGLGVMGVYDIVAAASRPRVASESSEPAVAHGPSFGPFTRTRGNGHDRARSETLGAH